MTVDGEIKFTFHPAAPIVEEETNKKFADALVELLEVVSGTKDVPIEESNDPLEILPKDALAKAVAAIGFASLLTHAGGYFRFFQSVMEMKNNVDPTDFWPALNFWIFFAVGHPILQPILWISDVLHGSPGPMVGGLVPITFLLGNIIAIGAFTFSKEVRISGRRTIELQKSLLTFGLAKRSRMQSMWLLSLLSCRMLAPDLMVKPDLATSILHWTTATEDRL